MACIFGEQRRAAIRAEQARDAAAFRRNRPVFLRAPIRDGEALGAHDHRMGRPASGHVPAFAAMSGNGEARPAAEFVTNRAAQASAGELAHDTLPFGAARSTRATASKPVVIWVSTRRHASTSSCRMPLAMLLITDCSCFLMRRKQSSPVGVSRMSHERLWDWFETCSVSPARCDSLTIGLSPRRRREPAEPTSRAGSGSTRREPHAHRENVGPKGTTAR
jgi:hypothetical protein